MAAVIASVPLAKFNSGASHCTLMLEPTNSFRVGWLYALVFLEPHLPTSNLNPKGLAGGRRAGLIGSALLFEWLGRRMAQDRMEVRR